MKKIVFVFILSIIILQFTFSQSTKVKLGFIAGINKSGINSNTEIAPLNFPESSNINTSFILSPKIGVFCDYQLRKHFIFNSQLNIKVQGQNFIADGRGTYSDYDSLGNIYHVPFTLYETGELKFMSINLPLSLNYYFSTNKLKPFIGIGVASSYLFAGTYNVTEKYKSHDYDNYDTYQLELYPKLDWQVTCRAGLDFKKFGFEINYSRGELNYYTDNRTDLFLSPLYRTIDLAIDFKYFLN